MTEPEKLNPQFNLKDLDLEQLTRALTENQNSLIKLVLVIGTLVLMVMMFNDHHAKESGVQKQMSQAQDKLAAIKVHDAAIEDLKDFKSSIPDKINEFELTSLISNYAKPYHIAIPSLSPSASKDMGLYDVIDLKFDAVADNFRDMMLFLRKIEKSKYPLRLNSWSGTETADGKVSFDIDINEVMIHP